MPLSSAQAAPADTDVLTTTPGTPRRRGRPPGSKNRTAGRKASESGAVATAPTQLAHGHNTRSTRSTTAQSTYVMMAYNRTVLLIK
jgi:hypothetical protein